MPECNGCGACCEPFVTVYGPFDLVRLAHTMEPEELAFHREHLTPMRRKDGRRMAAWNSGFSEFVIEGKAQLVATHYYKCDRYDPVAKLCTDYDNRPDVCRGFPWYGQRPDRRKSLPPTCSFNEDIGRPVEVAAPTRRRPASEDGGDSGDE
jgi:Fe-S-cluster containining protein